MTSVTFVALALAVVTVVVLVARQRSLRTALAEAEGEASAAGVRAEEAAGASRRREESSREEIAALTAHVAGLEASLEAEAVRLAELDASSRQRITELEREVHLVKVDRRRAEATAASRTADAEAAVARLAGAEAELVALRSAGAPRAPAVPASGPAAEDDGGETAWRLLLARVERQWADLVNAGADERGVADGSRDQQLAQAAARELERLREEVGVETTLVVAEPVGGGHALTTLLALGEAAALLAARSEHVTVALGNPVVVTGADWSGDDESRRRLEQLVATASAGGRPGAVEAADGAVRVVLGAAP